MRIRLATRRSLLALWQAEQVRTQIMRTHPDIDIDIVGITTLADKQATTPLKKLGGKGVFVKALESALIHNQADIAVHSIKDMTVNIPPELCLVATLMRTAPFDAWVSLKYPDWMHLPAHARIGTASLRRIYQANIHAPHPIQCLALRGNLDSRLKRLHNGEFDGLILAQAGLNRLKDSVALVQDTHYTPLAIEAFLPAPGQGAIGVECRQEDKDILHLLQTLNHPKTQYEVQAERSVARQLGGSCQVPVAAHAQCDVQQHSLSVTGEVGDGETKVRYRHTESGPMHHAVNLGIRVANRLLAQGAGKVIEKYLS